MGWNHQPVICVFMCAPRLVDHDLLLGSPSVLCTHKPWMTWMGKKLALQIQVIIHFSGDVRKSNMIHSPSIWYCIYSVIYIYTYMYCIYIYIFQSSKEWLFWISSYGAAKDMFHPCDLLQIDRSWADTIWCYYLTCCGFQQVLTTLFDLYILFQFV